MRATPLCVLGFSLAASPSMAQEREPETLITGSIDSGGFAGPVFKFSEVDDRFAFLLGFRGGWIVDHTFVLGAGLYGLVNTYDFDPVSQAGDLESHLYMGYGGIELEWVISSHRVVHLSLQGLVGAGGVGFDAEGSCCTDETADAFFVAEPGLNVMINVHRVFRVGLGGGYRFVSDVDLQGFDNDALSGATGTLTLKFGAF